MANSNEKEQVTKDGLIRLMKEGADLIRTAVDYRVLLVFMFYKIISDKWESIVEKNKKEDFPNEEAYVLANTEYLVLYDETEKKLYTWREATKSRETIKEITNSLIKISKLNENLSDMQKLVEVLGLLGVISEDKMHIFERLIQSFNQYDFSKIDYDAIGSAYEWILNYFAPTKAKEGENYTPREVIKLIVDILDIENGSTILDPACGSAGMLIEAYNYVKNEKVKGEKPSLELYGQEYNETMAMIAKMNLILHGIDGYKIWTGNSLTNPRFEEADYVVANPPWNQDGYDENNLGEPSIRKIYTSLGISGFTPKSSADWAWVQLMNYFAKKKVGVILDQGALFRGGREKNIRKAFVDKDLVEAVILLPEKLFYNTGAPGIVMIINKNKPSERKGKILFINASREYEQHPEIKRLNVLSGRNINNIVKAYREFKDIEGFARVVPLNEIRKNDYNLNVSLYVSPKEDEEKIDIAKIWEELNEIETQSQELSKKLEEYVSEIMKANGGQI